MQAFETTGRFWLPEKPDQDVAGTLIFDPSDRSSLNLIGNFRGHRMSAQRAPQRIHGVAGRHEINLEGCFLSSSQVHFPGGIEETWRVGAILRRIWIESDEDLAFDGASFDIDGLFEWTGRGGTQPEFLEEDGAIVGVTITHRSISREVHTAPSGQRVELEFPWQTTGDVGHEYGVAQGARVSVYWPDAQPLDHVLQALKNYQDLMTLAVGRGCAPRSVGSLPPRRDSARLSAARQQGSGRLLRSIRRRVGKRGQGCPTR